MMKSDRLSLGVAAFSLHLSPLADDCDHMSYFYIQIRKHCRGHDHYNYPTTGACRGQPASDHNIGNVFTTGKK